MNKIHSSGSRRKAYVAQFYRGNYGSFFLALLTTGLSAALNLVIAWDLQQLIDAVTGTPESLPLGTLLLINLGIVGLIVLIGVMQYLSKPQFMKKAMAQYKQFVFEKLTCKSIASFTTEDTSSYLSALSNDAASIETNYLENQFVLLTNSILLVGSLLMMLAYSPSMTVVSCVFFILPIGASMLAGNRMEDVERRVSDKNEAFMATLKDFLSGFSVVKSFQAENAVMRFFCASTQNAEQAKCEKRRLNTVISTLGNVAGVTAQLGTFLVGAYFAGKGMGITPGILITFLNLTAFVITPIQEMPGQLAARRAASALMDKLAQALEKNVRDEGVYTPNALEKGIALRDITFGYHADAPVLRNFSFTFEAGKSYAIVGASGSGKSTLLNLLMASRNDYSGLILYDGTELRELKCESLYDLVSMVQQNVFVFNASIRDNITMFSDFPKEEVENAIELSGLSDLIAQRGEGYLCGENGSGLSGGEKQRISIARALLKKSQILLVDEATAALDAKTAFQVSSAILELNNMTRIVVTHSLDAALLRHFDCILTLRNGALAEFGTFQNLMDRKGYFSSLYTVSQ